jgi:hypothetical protein
MRTDPTNELEGESELSSLSPTNNLMEMGACMPEFVIPNIDL